MATCRRALRSLPAWCVRVSCACISRGSKRHTACARGLVVSTSKFLFCKDTKKHPKFQPKVGKPN